MPSSSHYRTVAADLDRYAVELEACASSVIDPAARRLPDALIGDATQHLQAEYQKASTDIRASAGTIRTAAAWARAEADRIDAAAAAAEAAARVAAEAAAAMAEPAPEDTPADPADDADPALFF